MIDEDLGYVDGYSILSGAGVPSGSLGVDGDSYLNSTNGDIYSKSGGAWGSPTGNIQGIQGVQGFSILSGAGAPTTQGVNGDTYLNTTNGDVYLKSGGSWGSPTGTIRGPQGIQGIQGPIGFTTTDMTTANRILGLNEGDTVPQSPKQLEPVGLTLLNDKIYNGIEQGSGSTKIVECFNPIGGLYKGGESETGAIKIYNPNLGTSNSMTLIKGSIYLYDTVSANNRTCDFMITFYPYVMDYGYSAVFSGANAPKFTVRWFQNGAEPYVTIGELNQSWNFLGFVINTVISSFSSATIPNISTGWQISLITAFTGTQSAIVSETLPRPRLTYPAEEYNAASGFDTPLTNAMSPVQMFQNLQKQNDSKASVAEAQQLVDDIKIGGRNYLPNSNSVAFIGGTVDNTVLYNGKPTMKFVNPYSGDGQHILLKPNTWYTYSALVRSNFDYLNNFNNKPLHFHVRDINETSNGEYTSGYGNESMVANKWQVIYYSIFTTPTSHKFVPYFYTVGMPAGQVNVAWFKFEEGNKPTDWTPSPEDVQAAIDAKVADNLTASTTVAPSKTAVNTALALKADIAATTGTSVALTFTSDSVQGTIASPLTGNITGNITGAKLGVVTLVIHNHTTAPTFDSKYKKLSGSGSYVTGSINYIFCEYINDTEIIYSINQRT